MPAAGDDADGYFALALGQGIVAWLEMRAERARDFREFRIVHPDLRRARQAAAGLDHCVVALLLFRSHLVVLDFGVTAEGRGFRHQPSSFSVVVSHSHRTMASAMLSTRRTKRSLVP